MRPSIALALAVLLVAPGLARAQSSPARSRHAPAWIAVGAGSGFGVGLWAGLTGFDDSINSDRKVWTTASSRLRLVGFSPICMTRNDERQMRQRVSVRRVRYECVGCARVWCLAPSRDQVHRVYSLRSPASGESRDALAAGR